jgi:caffeoyl-CoA O-methyltransferase
MVGQIPDSVEEYAIRHTTLLPPLLEELKDLSIERYGGRTIVSAELAGMLLKFLVASVKAQNVLEIGTFTGFSALIMASALPQDGKLVTCEIDQRMAEVARGFFKRSPHGSKIKIRMGPALETMRTLEGPFDLIFIDADKENYINYYEASLELLAPNGLIAVDNVLWYGGVLDPRSAADHDIVAFNKHVTNDPRTENVLLTVRDGVMLVRRVG